MDGLWSASVIASAEPSSGQDTSQQGAQHPSIEEFQALQAKMDALTQKHENQRVASYKKIEEKALEAKMLRETLEAERAEKLRAQTPPTPATPPADQWASEGWASIFSSSLGNEDNNTREETNQVDPETFKQLAAEVAQHTLMEDKQRTAQAMAEGVHTQQQLQQRFFTEEPELANNTRYQSLVKDVWEGSIALNPDLPMTDRYDAVLSFVKRRAAVEAQQEEEARNQQTQNSGAWVNHSLTATAVPPPPQQSPYPSGGQTGGMPSARPQQQRAYTHDDRQRDLMADIQARKQQMQKRSLGR